MNSQKHCIYFYLILIFYIFVPYMADNGISPRKEKYLPDYNHYHNMSQIYIHLNEIIERNPQYMHLDNSFKSREGFSQLLIHIANFSDSRMTFMNKPFYLSSKVKVLLSYGEHAREFFPIESLFYFLTNLTQGLSSPRNSPAENFSRHIFSKVDLFIVALMNPDGRHYVEKTQNYCWRGTSTGVDINRNFDWNYGGEGSSAQKGTEELRGSQPFSEPECQILVELTRKHKFDAFISFHSGIREIYLPFADSISKKINRKPENLRNMMDLAKRMSEVMTPQFVYGQAAQIVDYPADGTVFDYMAGIRKIPFSYAIELWGEGDKPGMQCFDLFNPPSDKLEENLAKVHPLYEQLFGYLIEWKDKHVKNSLNIENDGPSLTLCFIMLGIVIVITIFASCNRRLPDWMRPHPQRRVISLKSLSSTLHVS